MMYAFWFLIGALAGVLTVVSHWFFVSRLQPKAGGKIALLFIGGFLFRLALAGVVIVLALLQGLTELLLAFAGMVIGTAVALIWYTTRKNNRSKDVGK